MNKTSSYPLKNREYYIVHIPMNPFGNPNFLVGGEYELDIVEEFYTDESRSEQHQQTHDLNYVQDIQKGLQQSVQALN